MGVYSPYSGVASNLSEAFNAVLKRLQNWREVPIDAIVLALYYLQALYSNEIQRGFAGLGNYSLSSEFAAAQWSADEIMTIATFQPEEIVARIQQKRIAIVVSSHDTEEKQETEVIPSDEDDFIPSAGTQHARARYFLSWNSVHHAHNNTCP